jgi:hypothetical protein
VLGDSRVTHPTHPLTLALFPPFRSVIVAGATTHVKHREHQSAAAWCDASSDIHTFWTFDSDITADQIVQNPNASTLDFVWGAASSHIESYRQ